MSVADPPQKREFSQYSSLSFWAWTADSRFAIFRYTHPQHNMRITAVFDTQVWDFILHTPGCDVVQGGSLVVYAKCGEFPVALSPVAPVFLMENGRLVELPDLQQINLLAGLENSYIGAEGSILAGWSPDGEYLAFVTTQQGNEGNEYMLYLANGNGGQLRTITPIEPYPSRLEWKPDGTTVTIITRKGANPDQQYILDVIRNVIRKEPYDSP